MKKQTITIITLVILLVFALGYIGVGRYNDYKQKKDLGIFKQGVQYGYEQTVIQIMNMASGCKPVPLRNKNKSINVISMNCLSQGGNK